MKHSYELAAFFIAHTRPYVSVFHSYFTTETADLDMEWSLVVVLAFAAWGFVTRPFELFCAAVASYLRRRKDGSTRRGSFRRNGSASGRSGGQGVGGGGGDCDIGIEMKSNNEIPAVAGGVTMLDNPLRNSTSRVINGSDASRDSRASAANMSGDGGGGASSDGEGGGSGREMTTMAMIGRLSADLRGSDGGTSTSAETDVHRIGSSESDITTHIDDRTGHTYSFNRVTTSTRWLDSDYADDNSGGGGGGGGGGGDGSCGDGGYGNGRKHEGTMVLDLETIESRKSVALSFSMEGGSEGGSTVGGVGDDWDQLIDEASGSPYFVHRKSGSAVWEKPE